MAAAPPSFATPFALSYSDISMPTPCPHCGTEVPVPDPDESQKRISDLQAQVKLLNAKAAAAVDRLADYEDEVKSLRARLQQENQISPPLVQTPSFDPKQSASRLSSLSAFLPGRKRDVSHAAKSSDPKDGLVPPSPGFALAGNLSMPNLATPTEASYNPSPPTFANDPGGHPKTLTLVSLQSSLEAERELRQKAESSLTQAQTELEELTAQLFGQANEMVATERKARAKLEERVKLLETRDTEKRKRLDRLEKAVARIERVRKMVIEHDEKARAT